MSCDENAVGITSGSFGEGLEMKGSYIDTMIVYRDIHVIENISLEQLNHNENFKMNIKSMKPCFARLKLIYSSDELFFQRNVYIAEKILVSV